MNGAFPRGAFEGGLLSGRSQARRSFDSFLTCALISPSAALLSLRAVNASALDDTLARARGSAPLSSLPLSLLAPGVALARYALLFLSNPVDSLVVALLSALLVAQDAVLYGFAYAAWSGRAPPHAFWRLVWGRPLLAALSLALRWAVLKALDLATWARLVRGDAAKVAPALVLDLLACVTVAYCGFFLRHSFATLRFGAHHESAHPERWGRVHALCASLQSRADLYSDVHWRELYELVPKGEEPQCFKETKGFDKGSGFTRLRLGRNRQNRGDLVVIKAVKLNITRRVTELMVSTALRCVRDTAAQLARGHLEESVDVLSDRFLELVQLVRSRVVDSHNRASQLMCDHEVRALRAAASLQPVGVVHFHTAHLCEGRVFPDEPAVDGPDTRSAVIVTAYVGPSWRTRQPESPKMVLKALRAVSRTLAKLHSAGIAHRDIKPANFASPADDPAAAVLLDMGIAALQAPSDLIMPFGTPKWSPPEAARAHSACDLALCFQGDVWSLGLLAVKLFAGQDVKAPELLQRAGVEGSSASAGSWTENSAKKLVGTVLTGCHNVCRDFKQHLILMLHPDPAKRPSMHAVKRFLERCNDEEFGDSTPASSPRAAAAAAADNIAALKARARAAVKAKFRRSRLSLLRQVISVVLANERARAAAGGPPPRAQLVPDPAGLVKSLQGALRRAVGDGKSATLPQFMQVLKEAGLLTRGGGALSVLPSGTHPQEVFRLLDADDSGGVSRCELLAGLAFLLAPGLDHAATLTLVFHAYDLDSSGSLSKDELFAMLRAYHFPTHSAADPAQLLKFFQRLDENHDDVVSLEEFLRGVRADKEMLAALEGGGALEDAASPALAPPPAAPPPAPSPRPAAATPGAASARASSTKRKAA